MEVVISANKFLDLLCCVIPVASNDSTRPAICTVQLEILAQDYAIRAIATNGFVLSVAYRGLGFSDDQQDIEDVGGREQIKDKIYLLSKVDAEILILSLKKLGVKKGREDESGGRYYIVMRENENKLSISILGLSHIVSEPNLCTLEFPDWKKLTPYNNNSNSSYLKVNLISLSYLNKCWGAAKVIIEFFNDKIKIIHDPKDKKEEDYLDKDFLLMSTELEPPVVEEKELIEKQPQFNFYHD